MVDSLFYSSQDGSKKTVPLAERIRPTTLEEVKGQEHLLAPGKFLQIALSKKQVPSLVFWGPPGSGKTTLALLIANALGIPFLSFSAVISGMQDIKPMLKSIEAKGQTVILFIDEIHRFNKLQQDAFLPYIEKGFIILIGATTENPSFELNKALLSRVKVLPLYPLGEEQLIQIIQTALSDEEKGIGSRHTTFSDEVIRMIVNYASGDARIALNVTESLALSFPEGSAIQDTDAVYNVMQKKISSYDKNGEMHYDFISALHKSLRGSDADAALYYLARMLESGEEPLYIARRLLRFSSEDIGLADTFAFVLAQATFQTCQVMGYPESDCALAELVIYLALAPKSNSAYVAIQQAKKAVEQYPNEPVPMFIRNAPTSLMKTLGYGDGYVYPHDMETKIVKTHYLPDRLKHCRFYQPTREGKEEQFKARYEAIRKRLDYDEKD